MNSPFKDDAPRLSAPNKSGYYWFDGEIILPAGIDGQEIWSKVRPQPLYVVPGEFDPALSRVVQVDTQRMIWGFRNFRGTWIYLGE